MLKIGEFSKLSRVSDYREGSPVPDKAWCPWIMSFE